MTVTFEDAPIDGDTIPPVSDIEYPCEVCGAESGPYGGRGRKPKKCATHKKNTSARTGSIKVTGNNAVLATQATEALSRINGFMALGAMLGGFHETAGAIGSADDGFRENVYAALVTDPDLCRYILRAGIKSGKIALVVAYGMFLASVGPTAVMELKTKQAMKAAEREMAEAA